MATKSRAFRLELEGLGIDPDAWAQAVGTSGDRADFFLALDLEDMIEERLELGLIVLSGDSGHGVTTIRGVYEIIDLARLWWPLDAD